MCNLIQAEMFTTKHFFGKNFQFYFVCRLRGRKPEQMVQKRMLFKPDVPNRQKKDGKTERQKESKKERKK